MPVKDHTPVATTVRYMVSIDGHDLGCFSECSGLGVDITPEQYEEGGNSYYVHQLPGRLKYSNIKLVRPLDAVDSGKVARWIASFAHGVTRANASITALAPDGEPLVVWNLLDVMPVKWQGPTFKSDGAPAVATETIELVHHGFLGG